jgi:glyoxylase-like metal-dependent hydrolase (beta-lactamase superfamily II)
MRDVAVIDPGPALDAHVAAIVDAVKGAERVHLLVTHGHPDHAPAASALLAVLGESADVDVFAPRSLAAGGSLAGATALADGDVVHTDQGDLVAMDTPGHAREHFAFHWPARRALFAGDLVLGRGDTVWVGEYAGCVADYLASIERVGSLDLDVIFPAHGDRLERPREVLDRFAAHRRERIRQVEAALAVDPGATADALLERVYGTGLPSAALRPALRSMEALKAHVEGRRE